MDDKVYEPEIIQDAPFPGQEVPVSQSNSASNPAGTYSPTTTKAKGFPIKRTAVELLSEVLNTRSRKILQSFDLAQSGGFQIGNFQEGISGDLRITPNGIVGRDIAGLVVFEIDTDGNATFKGQIQSGSVVTGRVVVGNNRVIIDVDESGEGRIVVNDGSNDRVLIGFQENGF